MSHLCNLPVIADDGDGESGPMPYQVGFCTCIAGHSGHHMDTAVESPLRLMVYGGVGGPSEAPILRIDGGLFVPSVLPGILDERAGYVALGRVIEIAAAMMPDIHSDVVRLEVQQP